ncbi:MAG: NTP transferase domain-containing protein, partial [Slackia isoflavoniconvertens]|nr:NTP transferase domain-containing protein [Slackia isoflavoniconvertens]
MTAKALILAAGAGTRMKSDKPKVVHEVLGKPLVRWVVDAAHDAGIEDVVTVLGHMSEHGDHIFDAGVMGGVDDPAHER